MLVVSHDMLEGIWVWNATLRSAGQLRLWEMQRPANLFFHVGQVWFLKVPVGGDRSEIGISN